MPPLQRYEERLADGVHVAVGAAKINHVPFDDRRGQDGTDAHHFPHAHDEVVIEEVAERLTIVRIAIFLGQGGRVAVRTVGAESPRRRMLVATRRRRRNRRNTSRQLHFHSAAGCHSGSPACQNTKATTSAASSSVWVLVDPMP